MNYEGVEVDMLSLGNADSILVTQWKAGVPTRILIDGGNSNSAETVLAFLKKRGITVLDHIVCSHPHNDHAVGLVGVVQSKDIDFGRAWIHLPWAHVDDGTLTAALRKGEVSAKRVVNIVRASVQSAQNLVKAVNARGKPISEPFKGAHIGCLFVCGPSQEFYEQLLKEFTDFEKLNEMEAVFASADQRNLVESLFEGIGGQEMEGRASGLGQAPTEPENNSSTILWTKHGEDALLFTADAGVEALNMAKATHEIGSLRWMQIPHHGSRRNVNEELISYFKPATAFVSAEGTKKHPRRAVVNAFKAVGTNVFSTHYPDGGHLHMPIGNVPPRADYSPATALYEADKDKNV